MTVSEQTAPTYPHAELDEHIWKARAAIDAALLKLADCSASPRGLLVILGMHLTSVKSELREASKRLAGSEGLKAEDAAIRADYERRDAEERETERRAGIVAEAQDRLYEVQSDPGVSL